MCPFGFAAAFASLYDSIDYWLQLSGRLGAYAEQVWRLSLVVEGLLTVPGTRLYLFEQPYIVDRYDGLVGKCLDEIHLSFREWLNVCVPNRDNANNPATLFQRYAHGGLDFVADTALEAAEKRVSADIGDMYGDTMQRNPTGNRIHAGTERIFLHLLEQLGVGNLVRRDVVGAVLAQQTHMPMRCPAQPHCRLSDHIEHWLQLVGRARDDRQNLGGRSLIFERFLKLAFARLLGLE